MVKACIEKAQTQIVTLALRRANEGGLANILDYIPDNITLLPNTIHQGQEMQRKLWELLIWQEKWEEAIEAQKLGATYISAGHIFATDCKKDLPPRGLEFLKEVCNSVTIPVYAIGGIKLSDVQMDEIIKCGAKGGCIMSGMMSL